MKTDTRAQTQVRDVQMIIGGEQVDAAEGMTFDVTNPATGEVIARAPLAGPVDVDRAVRAARAA
ncbi:MAG: aldehyde dehydrogenase family protein, partial [Candidatus Limnocylindria bacterium]